VTSGWLCVNNDRDSNYQEQQGEFQDSRQAEYFLFGIRKIIQISGSENPEQHFRSRKRHWYFTSAADAE
jgi:hypothetical protein